VCGNAWFLPTAHGAVHQKNRRTFADFVGPNQASWARNLTDLLAWHGCILATRNVPPHTPQPLGRSVGPATWFGKFLVPLLRRKGPSLATQGATSLKDSTDVWGTSETVLKDAVQYNMGF